MAAMLTFRSQLSQLIERMRAPATREFAERLTEFLKVHNVDSVADLRSLALGGAKDVQAATTAIWLLARLQATRDSATTMLLLGLLRSQDREVRAEVARAFAVRKTPQALPHLEHMLRTDEHEDAQLAAAYALGQMGYDSGAEVLLAVLSDHARPRRLRGMAAEALGFISYKSVASRREAVDKLVVATSDRHPEVRLFAAHALGALRAKEAATALEKLSRDSESAAPFGTVADTAVAALDAIRSDDTESER